MKRVILSGCNGRMGKAVQHIIKHTEGLTLVAGVDKYRTGTESFPVFLNMRSCDVEADVVIDFSNPSTTDELIDICIDREMALVICTTGLSNEQLASLQKASGRIPILRSANMSLGINVMQKLIRVASEILYNEGFDIEIVEKHHRMKLDAPSGTALMLADSARDALNTNISYVYSRDKERKERQKPEIGIVSVRGGGIVGDHELIYAGESEVISIRHEAFSRSIFAKGAVTAAAFLADREPGLYSMQDVIGR